VECLRIRPTEAATTASSTQIICEGCGKPIEAAYGMNPEQLAANTKAKFGKAYCSACAIAESEKQKK
jgi:hypothetical protein